MLNQILLPSLNVLNIDVSLRAYIMPVQVFSSKYDCAKTCCRINQIFFINLDILTFSRSKIYTLSKYMWQILEAFENKTNTFPTPMFDSQDLIDIVCVLLILVDKFLKNIHININYRNMLYANFAHLFSGQDLNVFANILHRLKSREQLMFAVHSVGALDLHEIECQLDCIFVPIQNTNISLWLKRYHGVFYVRFLRKFNYNVSKSHTIDARLPQIVFGLSDQKKCYLFKCTFNKLEFLFGTRIEFVQFLNRFLANMYFPRTVLQTIVLCSELCLQDFLLIFECIIRSAGSRCRKRASLELMKFKNYAYEYAFNNHVFCFYLYYYIAMFHVKRKKIGRLRFKFSLMADLRAHRLKHVLVPKTSEIVSSFLKFKK